MRMLSKLLLLICFVLAATTANAIEHRSGAYGEYGAWSFEFGQGVRSARTVARNASLEVACVQTATYVQNSLYLSLGPNSVSGDFGWQIDNEAPIILSMRDGGFVADTLQKAQLFEQIIAGLKRGGDVLIWLVDEPVTRFSLSGSSKAIGDCTVRSPYSMEFQLKALSLKSILKRRVMSPTPMNRRSGTLTNTTGLLIAQAK